MTKEELLELNVPEESIKEIMRLHGINLEKVKRKAEHERTHTAPKLREAICGMLPVLKENEHLRHILNDVTYFYHKEAVKTPQTHIKDTSKKDNKDVQEEKQ